VGLTLFLHSHDVLQMRFPNWKLFVQETFDVRVSCCGGIGFDLDLAK